MGSFSPIDAYLTLDSANLKFPVSSTKNLEGEGKVERHFPNEALLGTVTRQEIRTSMRKSLIREGLFKASIHRLKRENWI